MKSLNLGIIVDHDYQSGDIVSPAELMASADLVRRTLEDTVTCKQIGPCLFSFNAEQKEAAFKAINNLEEHILNLRITVTFVMLEPLDTEFKAWQANCW